MHYVLSSLVYWIALKLSRKKRPEETCTSVIRRRMWWCHRSVIRRQMYIVNIVRRLINNDLNQIHQWIDVHVRMMRGNEELSQPIYTQVDKVSIPLWDKLYQDNRWYERKSNNRHLFDLDVVSAEFNDLCKDGRAHFIQGDSGGILVIFEKLPYKSTHAGNIHINWKFISLLTDL